MTDDAKSNVTAIYGSPTFERTPSRLAIEMLERWLEMARSGEITGVLIVGQHADGCGNWQIGGRVGTYSMLGALETAKHDLLAVMADD